MDYRGNTTRKILGGRFGAGETEEYGKTDYTVTL
jgi:hypothetical protein